MVKPPALINGDYDPVTSESTVIPKKYLGLYRNSKEVIP